MEIVKNIAGKIYFKDLFLGFEVGGPDNLNVYNWSIVGDGSSISHTSCFKHNKAALQMEVYCGVQKPCPYGDVDISNPGYLGMVRKLIYVDIHTHPHYRFIFPCIIIVYACINFSWYTCVFKYHKNEYEKKDSSNVTLLFFQRNFKHIVSLVCEVTFLFLKHFFMFRILSEGRGIRWSIMLNQKESLIFNCHSRVLML